MDSTAPSTDTSQIRDWRSIVTLLVFIITNLIVLFPFHVPVYLPRPVCNSILDGLAALRIISPRRRRRRPSSSKISEDEDENGKKKAFVRFNFPVDFVTAPLIADLFLLAILAIHAKEVSAGTIGDNNIYPYEIMIFFITLAYIAISIDASGLIRYLAFRVLQWGGKVGHRLFLYLYVFFFGVSSFIGNDPVILSGTAFLAYMTRVSSNITHPRAWIHTQFAVANIASAILVSSNPTNLVLAGAFNIRFVDYTANMIVPVIITAIVLFPFLLYIVFANEELIPLSIDMHELSEEAQARPAVNPNIPNARGAAEEEEARMAGGDQRQLLSLEEIMNPYIDSRGASVGAVIMTVTLISVLVINAVSDVIGRQPVYYITLPAAVLMLSWDLSYGWLHRKETREIARKGREEIELAHLQRAMEEEETARQMNSELDPNPTTGANEAQTNPRPQASTEAGNLEAEQHHHAGTRLFDRGATGQGHTDISGSERTPSDGLDDEKRIDGQQAALSIGQDSRDGPQRTTLVSICRRGYRWSQETFPTVTAVISHLPFALIPFAFTMFVLVQALVSAGWIAVFAYGWDHWVNKTGTLGAIGGMAFLSVVLCNFAGTNIGTTILLSRLIQTWAEIHIESGMPISDRTFWATVYSMAIGVNYGAFSTAFSASLAGLLWRDILARKHIHVRRLEFARVNLPIIVISMLVGCAVLTGEVYIKRGEQPAPLQDLVG